MSYCRFGEGDVYMFPADKTIECCMCILSGIDDPWDGASFTTRSAALEHLREHERAGHYVPLRAIERLEREIRDTGEDTSINPWAVYREKEPLLDEKL